MESEMTANNVYNNTYIIILLCGLIIYCAYNIIYYAITYTDDYAHTDTTSSDQTATTENIYRKSKVKQIRDEMLRLEHIELLRSKIKDIQERGGIQSDVSRLNDYVNSLYAQIESHITQLYKYVMTIMYDIVAPRLYKYSY
jgi:hypothetical protein